jgi:hypothetical protein
MARLRTRPSCPGAVADAALYVNSKLAASVTGVALPVDAGHLLLSGLNTEARRPRSRSPTPRQSRVPARGAFAAGILVDRVEAVENLGRTARAGHARPRSFECDSVAGDYLLHAQQRAVEYQFGAFHQAWLVESWTSHATLMSAQAYFTMVDEEATTELHPVPKDDQRRTLAAVTSALHAALTGYERVVPDAFAGRLADWHARFEELAVPLKA